MRRYTDRTVKESIESVTEMTVMTKAGTCPEKGPFPEIVATMLETDVLML